MEKETIMIDGVRYYADRPRSCRRCYFWKNRKTGCVLKKENCYYLAEAPKTWNSMAILIVLEVFLVLITAGTGVIEGVLQMASESLGGFMRS